MIFSTQNQLNSVLIFIFWGIIIGILSEVLSVLFFKNHQKKLIKLLFLTVFYAFFSIFFIFLINFLNFGKFSFVLLICYLSGYKFLKHHVCKIVVIFEKAWYNKINMMLKSKHHKRKTKERKTQNEISSKS